MFALSFSTNLNHLGRASRPMKQAYICVSHLPKVVKWGYDGFYQSSTCKWRIYKCPHTNTPLELCIPEQKLYSLIFYYFTDLIFGVLIDYHHSNDGVVLFVCMDPKFPTSHESFPPSFINLQITLHPDYTNYVHSIRALNLYEITC